jgi:uncharacterized membrane protein
MQFSDDIIIRVILFLAGVTGFFIARHIYRHKKDVENVPLTCPVGFDCTTVVHSDYSRILGVRVEVLGMIYYALISLSYLFLIFMPDNLPILVIGLLLGISSLAFLFSVYLTGVQAFILKNWCSWCLVSAGLSVIIFLLNIFAYDALQIIPAMFH